MLSLRVRDNKMFHIAHCSPEHYLNERKMARILYAFIHSTLILLYWIYNWNALVENIRSNLLRESSHWYFLGMWETRLTKQRLWLAPKEIVWRFSCNFVHLVRSGDIVCILRDVRCNETYRMKNIKWTKRK